tara:strand:- start:5118 stop:5324 length:207 start_codon:yes stop_codon:yes gene_type:complete
MSMNVFINREKASTPKKTSIELLLANLGVKNKFIAVEVNRVIVPKSNYRNYYLKENDKVEIIRAVGGG